MCQSSVPAILFPPVLLGIGILKGLYTDRSGRAKQIHRHCRKRRQYPTGSTISRSPLLLHVADMVFTIETDAAVGVS